MDRRESGTGEAAADKTSCDDIRTGLEGEISGQNDVIGEGTLLGGKNGSDLWDDFYPPAGYPVGKLQQQGESELYLDADLNA